MEALQPLTNYKRLAVDQYGDRYYFTTIADLRSQIGRGGSKVSKMYHDVEKGFEGAECVGRVIGGHWLTFYIAIQS